MLFSVWYDVAWRCGIFVIWCGEEKWHGVTWCGAKSSSQIRYDEMWCGAAWYHMKFRVMWCHVLWCDVVCRGIVCPYGVARWYSQPECAGLLLRAFYVFINNETSTLECGPPYPKTQPPRQQTSQPATPTARRHVNNSHNNNKSQKINEWINR